MGYNPRKRPELAEITTFADTARVVHHGSHGIKILPGPENHGYNPRKRLEMAENMTFADLARVVYRGTHGIKFCPGLENHGL